MKKVTLKGVGQLNGSVVIDKIIELDDNIAIKLNGPHKNDVLKSIMDTHYPGVKFNPNQIGINVSNENKSINSSKGVLKNVIVGTALGSTTKSKSNNVKKSNSIEFKNEIEHLLRINYSSNKSEIESDLNEIFLTLKSYKWPLRSDSGEANKNNTRILNQVYEKYKIGYQKLKNVVSNQEEIAYHTKQFKRLRLKKLFNQYGLWIYSISTVLIIILFIIIIDIFRL